MSLTESTVEEAALAWFGELGYAVGQGPQLAPSEPAAEREEVSIWAQSRPFRDARFPFVPRIVPPAGEFFGSPRAAGTGLRFLNEQGALGQRTLFTGVILEGAAMEQFGPGPRMASSEPAAERDSFGEVVLAGQLR